MIKDLEEAESEAEEAQRILEEGFEYEDYYTDYDE